MDFQKVRKYDSESGLYFDVMLYVDYPTFRNSFSKLSFLLAMKDSKH